MGRGKRKSVKVSTQTATAQSGEILESLRKRGLIRDCTSLSGLKSHLQASRAIYCGFDPTATSLHVGNLLPLLALRRFQLAGHKPIALIGGGTGLIGDPSGKQNERQLLSEEIVQERAEAVRAQIERFLDCDGTNKPIIVDNNAWLGQMKSIDFLRDFGKHFSLGVMLGKESVKSRLEQGISFTEFSYMILQAIDFLELQRRYNCTVQVGGSDQWGNITAGVDLVRRECQKEVYGLTLPLLTKTDGTKFGKTESGSVWLNKEQTSAFSLYQFFYNIPDAEIGGLLRSLSLRPYTEIEALDEETRLHPEMRQAQKELAKELVSLVHGEVGLSQALRVSEALFKEQTSVLSREDILSLRGVIPTKSLKPTAITFASAAVEAGLATSKSRARELIKTGSLYVFDQKVEDADGDIAPSLRGNLLLLRRGRKAHALLEFKD